MLISTEINSFRKSGNDKEIIKMIKDAGFTAYDYTMSFFASEKESVLDRADYKEYAEELRAYADGIGIICNQAHGPFPHYLMTVRTEEYTRLYHEMIRRAIKISGILGAKIIVIHPEVRASFEENVKFFESFKDTAIQAGVKIGIENVHLYNPGDPLVAFAVGSDHNSLPELLDSLDPNVFVACLDIGHAEMDMLGCKTSAVQMIECLGSRLQAMHLHDNLKGGINDNHAIPFSRLIQFEPIIKAFQKNNYKGDITLETCGTVDTTPNELLPVLAQYMAAIANYFKNRIENNN